jgi:hypothetical protein
MLCYKSMCCPGKAENKPKKEPNDAKKMSEVPDPLSVLTEIQLYTLE